MTLAAADPLVPLLLGDCRRWIQAGRRPLIGLNGPVGAGKSSLAAALRQAFAAEGLQLAVASIDDAYLPWPERQQRMRGNPFGVSRVPPGSHDPCALLKPLRRWRDQPWPASGTATAALQLPRFDKTLRGGDGDRIEPWQGEADAVLLEGWLIGCQPRSEAELSAWQGMAGLAPAERDWLRRCNGWLHDYQDLWAELDGLVMLWPCNWQQPRRWRFQAEGRQRRSGGGWMGAEALDRLVAATLRSLPADLYQRPLLAGARWVRVLDGRRRCRWQGPGDALILGVDQSSSPCSSATG